MSRFFWIYFSFFYEIIEFFYESFFELLIYRFLYTTSNLFEPHIKVFKYHNSIIFNDKICEFVYYCRNVSFFKIFDTFNSLPILTSLFPFLCGISKFFSIIDFINCIETVTFYNISFLVNNRIICKMFFSTINSDNIDIWIMSEEIIYLSIKSVYISLCSI